MNLFKKFLQYKDKLGKEKKPEEEERGKFMPEPEIPTDENFMVNFKENGGKFLYCENIEEVLTTFQQILDENNWNGKEVCCFNPDLQTTFKNFKVSYSKNPKADLFLTTCEYLIAKTGALLVSSNQIKETKLHELPSNFVVFASTSQLIDTIGEGLRGIKAHHKNKIPSNITTIKTFKDKQEGDFMSYGSTSKNLYLLLLEDL